MGCLMPIVNDLKRVFPMKKILPTSTAGSLPKPSWLAEPEKLWSPWRLEGEELLEAKRDALLLSLKEQEAAGIDIISDGEQTRQHFVTTFIEHLSGVDFEKRETVRIRDRYDASVPTVYDAVARTKPVFVEDAKFLRQHTDRVIKWALPGPMTMIDTLYDAHYKSREKLAWEFAKILNEEVSDSFVSSCGFSSIIASSTKAKQLAKPSSKAGLSSFSVMASESLISSEPNASKTNCPLSP